jgi:mRNA-degrading endonuclease YafQ of YafQ-DinJ toxin-antitoxin module
MIEIYFTKSFLKQVKLFEKDLQEEILEKIELFKNRDNHKSLQVHKLHGYLKDNYSFYVNYRIRIVFTWKDKEEVIFMLVGDHDLYK